VEEMMYKKLISVD